MASAGTGPRLSQVIAVANEGTHRGRTGCRVALLPKSSRSSATGSGHTPSFSSLRSRRRCDRRVL
jgi:hypothetical protein